MTNKHIYSQLAHLLDNSLRHRQPTECITVNHPSLTLHDAYQIQKEGIDLRMQRGEKITGYKMGLTSRAKQLQMHVDTPIFGVLTNIMELKDGQTVSLSKFIQPKIEPEIAFVLGKDLHGEVSQEEAIDACAGICAALDVIDSRYINFKFTLIDIIADNCSAGGYVLGPIIKPADINLANLSMSLKANDAIVGQGSSNAILGNPINALIMLSQMLAAERSYLKAGSIILSGASTDAFNLGPRLKIINETQSLGSVTLNITA